MAKKQKKVKPEIQENINFSEQTPEMETYVNEVVNIDNDYNEITTFVDDVVENKVKNLSIDDFVVENINTVENNEPISEPNVEINIKTLSKLDQRMFAKTGKIVKTKENHYDRFNNENK